MVALAFGRNKSLQKTMFYSSLTRPRPRELFTRCEYYLLASPYPLLTQWSGYGFPHSRCFDLETSYDVNGEVDKSKIQEEPRKKPI